MAYCALHKGKFPDDEPCPFCAPAAPQSDPRPTCSYWTDKQEGDVIKRYFCMLEPGHNDEHMLTTGLTVGRRLAPQSDQPEQGVSVDSVEHLAFMLANEVIERTEPRHKRETAFLLLKALRAAPTVRPAQRRWTHVNEVYETPSTDAERVPTPASQPAQGEPMPRNDYNEPFVLAKQRVAIVERVMKLPYIKAQRDTEEGEVRFVCRDDVISTVHDYAKIARGAAPASQPVAPAQPTEAELYGGEERYDGPRGALMQIKKKSSPGANAEEVFAGYFDPKDIRERWAQLYNRCTFTSDPHAVPYTRYVTVDTATFDEFAHDFAALLESFRAETLEPLRELVEKWRRADVPAIWAIETCKKHDDYVSDCVLCNEEVTTSKTTKAYQVAQRNSAEELEAALGSDPNWLARQIAEAQIAELDALETIMDEAGVLAERGSVAQILYKNRRRAALAATKSQLTEGK